MKTELSETFHDYIDRFERDFDEREQAVPERVRLRAQREIKEAERERKARARGAS